MSQVVTTSVRVPQSGANADGQHQADDNLSKRGAMALAKRLENYWRMRGYPAARFWAEPIDERFSKVGTYEIYRVNSNLVNALPPRYRDDPS